MINSNVNTHQLHATDEGQGAPATAAPHDVLLALSGGPRGAETPQDLSFKIQKLPKGRLAGLQPR